MQIYIALVAALAMAVLISGMPVKQRLMTKLLFILLVLAFGISVFQVGWQRGAGDMIRTITGGAQQNGNPNTGSVPIRL